MYYVFNGWNIVGYGQKNPMIIRLMDNQRAGCSSAAKLTYHALVRSQRKET